MEFDIEPRKIFLSLGTLIGTLVILNITVLTLKFNFGYGHGHGETLLRLFDLDGENNIPAFFSSLQLMLAGTLLLSLGWCHKNIGDRYFAWLSLGWIFVFLSVDEITSIHEQLVDPCKRILHFENGLFHFAWIIPYLAILLLLSPTYFRFLRSLPKKFRHLFLFSGAVYLVGAVLVEILGGMYANVYGENNPIYACFYTVEESLEQIGIALFIFSLITYLGERFHFLSISIKTSRSILS